MTEEDLRALVRAAVERHLSASGAPPPVAAAPQTMHPSFFRYRLPIGGEDDGACLIEPAVRCTHCGFCQSHGY
jgi:hypothetical protein